MVNFLNFYWLSNFVLNTSYEMQYSIYVQIDVQSLRTVINYFTNSMEQSHSGDHNSSASQEISYIF
jgi:hypothetical protein